MINRFIIIIPAYNVEKWIALNLETIKLQTYSNFKCIIIDDASTDGTVDIINRIIEKNSKFHLLKNIKHIGSSLRNYKYALDFIKPADEDIIIWLDGDDWLSSTFVLEYLDCIYEVSQGWMTYGTYQVYPSGILGDHHCKKLANHVHEERTYREYEFVFSHLRTHKYFLWQNIKQEDLIDNRTNKFYTECTDCAYLFPMAEMSGKDKIYLCRDTLLILNRAGEIHVGDLKLQKQKETEEIIRQKSRYPLLENK